MGKRYLKVTKIVSRSVSCASLGETKLLWNIIGSIYGRKQVLVISLIIPFGHFISRLALNLRKIPTLNYNSIARFFWLVRFVFWNRTPDILKRRFRGKNSRLQNQLTSSILATSPVWSHPLSSSDSLVFSSFPRYPIKTWRPLMHSWERANDVK